MEDKERYRKWTDRVIDWFDKRQNQFWGKLCVPFIICFKYPVDFFLWMMFVIVAGQLGTIINVVNRTLFGGMSLPRAIYPDSVFGSFYTYALVLIASLVAPLFTRIKDDTEPKFRSMTIVFVTLLMFTLLLCAVFFSFASQEISCMAFKGGNGNITVDGKQLIFVVLAVVYAWYALGLSLMVQNKECLKYDDYSIKEKNDVDKIGKKGVEVTNDGKGTAI